MVQDIPGLAHSPGAWVATHTQSVLCMLVLIGHVVPAIVLRWIPDPWRASQVQLTFSGAQIVLALVAWVSVIGAIEQWFHAHNCYCRDAPEIRLRDVELSAGEPPTAADAGRHARHAPMRCGGITPRQCERAEGAR